jgi:hypothetical protein
MMNKFEKYSINFVLITTVIAYFQLFKFVVIPTPVQTLSQIAAVGIILFFIIMRFIYFDTSHAVMNFKWPILLLLLGAVPSFFIAFYFHQQSFIISAYANRLLLFYLLYFFLHLYKVPPQWIIRIIVVTGLFAVLLYYIQMALYPRMIMNLMSMEQRGTIRLFIPGMICTTATYFYFLNRFFETNSFKFLLFSLVTLSVFVLQGTRQLIFATFFLTVVNLMLSNRVKSKFLMVFLMTLASFAVFMIFQNIFLALTQVSSNQSQNIENDIRVRAAKFFLTTFMPNDLAYIFGNGNAEGGSGYALQNLYYAQKYGFYQNDIGMIGDYVRYGILFTLASFVLLAKAFLIKIGTSYRFLKYFIAAQCFTLLAGKGVLGGADIILICSLYIFDIEHAKLKLKNK